jgi:hypothetical protein
MLAIGDKIEVVQYSEKNMCGTMVRSYMSERARKAPLSLLM